MERHAFIDVANTKGTASTALEFYIDWQKLFNFFSGGKWQCANIFYYEGGTDSRIYKNRFKKLSDIGYSVKTKQIFSHKNKEKVVTYVCAYCEHKNDTPVREWNLECYKCKEINDIPIIYGSRRKANFDVEITCDALEFAKPKTEILLFTGDGDFCYLAEKLVSLGARVTFVSTVKETSKNEKRFSTRLRSLINSEESRYIKTQKAPRVRLLEMNNFKLTSIHLNYISYFHVF